MIDAISLQEKVVLFCAGKSAGTSISNLLHQELGSIECFREFQHLSYSALGHIHRDQLETYLRSLPKSRLAPVRVLVGHLPVKLGETMPDTQFRYATIIREPVARMISVYFYINQQNLQTNDTEHLNALLHQHISGCNDVVYANPFTRLLTGSEALVPREPPEPYHRPLPISDADFAAARECLRNFAFVGLTERLMDSTRLLFRLIGREFDGEIPIDNTTPITLSPKALHPDTTCLMERTLALDIDLYSDAVEMFGRQAAKNNVATYHYNKPERKFGSLSSGDESHLTSAASAFTDCGGALWVASPKKNGTGEWLGYDFGSEVFCRTVCVQLPRNNDEEILLQIEASSDGFFNEIFELNKFAARSDGKSRLFKFKAQSAMRYWRVRCIQKKGDRPLAICYLKFNATTDASSRDLSEVENTARKSRLLFQR